MYSTSAHICCWSVKCSLPGLPDVPSGTTHLPLGQLPGLCRYRFTGPEIAALLPNGAPVVANGTSSSPATGIPRTSRVSVDSGKRSDNG